MKRRINKFAILMAWAIAFSGINFVSTSSSAIAATTVTNVAGTGVDGYNGTDIAANTAKLWGPNDLAVNTTGEVYVADRSNQIVRKIDTGGTIRLVQGVASTPRLPANGCCSQPNGVTVSNSGTVYTSSGHLVWAGSTIVAGNSTGAGGYSGNGGAAYTTNTQTKLSQPAGLAYDDSSSTLYIVDQGNCTVRKVYNGFINNVAGTGPTGCGYTTGSGVATSAQLRQPTGVAVARGMVYIADTNNNRIRKVDPVNNTISTIAGTGSSSDTGDGGLAVNAGVQAPKGVAADYAGNVFIGTNSGAVRMIDVGGKISTITNVGSSIQGMARSGNGDLYVTTANQYVKKITGFWPPAQPGNSSVSIDAPSPSDDFLERQISIGLSATGNQSYDYGWSTTNTIAPTTLQTSTDMTNRKGTLDYSATNPNEDWYLWVRSVQTGGTPNAWATPLKVRTPQAPIWVGVGDSYSSGHHQASDEQYCPDVSDGSFYPTSPICLLTGGLPHVTWNDTSFSWVSTAVASINSAPNTPTQWQYSLDLVAKSGTASENFGDSTQTPGTDAWAAGWSSQASKLKWDLLARYDSWNIVSVTGGANDTSWQQIMKDWYKDNFTAAPEPWSYVPVDAATDCPNSETVYNQLQGSIGTDITSNLQGVVDLSDANSPGVRVLTVGYPYILDSTSDCAANDGTWEGFNATVDALNASVFGVTSANVKDVDLTLSGNFGSSPITNNLIQETRLYGYPHASSGGQNIVASAAVGIVRGSGW